MQLQTAAWEGLRSLLRGNEVSGSGSIRGLTDSEDVSDAVYQAMQGLFALLPSPPATLPGALGESTAPTVPVFCM